MNELENLRNKILKFNELYEKGTPIVEDCVYDYYKKLLSLLEEDKTLKISDNVGTKPIENEVKHLFPILSLEHDFGKEKIEKFINRIEKKTNPLPLIGEVKIDGVSIIVRYNNGLLEQIATRGNGIKGQDITHLKNYISLPNEVFIKQLIEIRFEAYLEKNVIKNARNVVAGMLLKKEIDPKLKFLKFAPHNLYSQHKIWDSYQNLINIFEKMHLSVIKPNKICSNLNELIEFFDEINTIKNELPFEIDGIVFKIDKKSDQELLGNTAKAPKFAFAIKFDNPFAFSKIIEIKFQISRFGKMTPIAIFEEAKINGRNITKATLNNFNDLQDKQYAKGDIIKIEMAGEVIPKITQIIEKSKNKTVLPTHCCSCNEKLENDICLTGWNCFDQKLEKLEYFISKPCLNIKGMSLNQVKFFVENDILNFPYDFFEIKNNINKAKQNASWLGPKALENLLESIEKSKFITMESWYTSLGMPNLGKNKVKLLIEEFLNFEDFLKCKLEDLNFLGPTVSKNVYKYKENEKYWMKKTWKYMHIDEKYKSQAITLF